jgi:hypothetical protein
MNSFPRADEIVEAYADQVEALEHLFHARAALTVDSKSRFHGLSEAAIQDRLEHDREELDRWTVMMLTASFEATIRTDAEDRIRARTKDDVRKSLQELYRENNDRVRLDDVLATWENHATVGQTVKQRVRTLLKHRHWLAHGRHWTNKHGAMPPPLDARAFFDDYVQSLQACAPDFPRG